MGRGDVTLSQKAQEITLRSHANSRVERRARIDSFADPSLVVFQGLPEVSEEHKLFSVVRKRVPNGEWTILT